MTQTSKMSEDIGIPEGLRTLDLKPVEKPVWDPTLCIPSFSELPEQPSSTTYREIVESGVDVLINYGLAIPSFNFTDVIRGMEVGDDRADCSTSPLPLAIAIFAQAGIYRFSTSYKDTGISTTCYNFCEVTSMVPSTQYGTISHAKRSDFDKLEFVDAPPLRIIIDVQKGDRGHSSSVSGKASMLGSRIISARTELKPILEVSSWIQDATLGTCNAPEPKYLPTFLAGSNVPSLWGGRRNMYAYLKCYKHGTYERIYGSAINELREVIRDLDQGRIAQPVLANFLRLKRAYLHVTYGANVAVPQLPLRIPNRIVDPEPLYMALGGTSLLQGVENRLVQCGKILTKTAANSEIAVTHRNLVSLFGDYPLEYVGRELKLSSRLARERFEGALSAHSAIQRLLRREANDEDFIRALTGKFLCGSAATQTLTVSACDWVHQGGRGEAFVASDLLRSEDMYLTDEVSMESSLRVGGIPITPRLTQNLSKTVETIAKVGLWQITKAKEEWAEDIVSRLSLLRSEGKILSYQDVFPIFYDHREWVRDDSLLIRRATDIAADLSSASILLVSDDIRLARVMAKTSGLPIVVTRPVDVIRRVKPTMIDDSWKLSVSEAIGFPAKHNVYDRVLPPIFDEVLIDTGSVAAAAQKVDVGHDLNGYPTGVYYKVELQRTGLNEAGLRFEVIKRQKLNGNRASTVRSIWPNQEERVHTFVEDSLSIRPSIFERSNLTKRFYRR
jgi:hypothetical protein